MAERKRTGPERARAVSAPISIESAFVGADGVSRLRRHFHNRHEILLIESGAADYGIEDRKYAVSEGSLIVVSRLERHEVRISAQPYVRRFLLVDPAFFQTAVKDPALASLFRSRPPGYSHHVHLEGEDFEAVRSWLVRLHEETLRSGPFQRNAESALLRLFAIELYRRRPELFPVHSEQRGSLKVAEAQSLIEARFAEPGLDLSAIAAGTFCSPDHLSHQFKRLTGYSVMRYVALQRIACARELLALGCAPVSEVCTASGFGNTSHFIRAFRAETGDTPLKFRRKAEAGEAGTKARPMKSPRSHALP
jgi:AraC-like DNA-binding protein